MAVAAMIVTAVDPVGGKDLFANSAELLWVRQLTRGDILPEGTIRRLGGGQASCQYNRSNPCPG